jgi:hypothetical protein
LRYANTRRRKNLQYLEIAVRTCLRERRGRSSGVGDESPGEGVGTYGREKEWNGTVRDGWNFRECEKGEIEFLGMELIEGKMLERNF